MSVNFTIGADPTTRISLLAKHGIKRVYCGYVDKSIIKKYPLPFFTINWRGELGSFESTESFSRFAREAERNNISINVTFNSLYVPEQYTWILEAIDFVSQFESVKGIIINDMGLALRLKKINYNKNIIFSINSNSFNSSIVTFYKDFGAKEIVFPRQTKIEEMIDVMEKHSEMNFEIFLLFGNCLYIDGFCSLAHCVEEQKSRMFNPKKRFSNCGLLMEADKCSVQHKNYKNMKNIKRELFIDMITHGCNLCSINKLNKYSKHITYKIVSRGMDLINSVVPYLDLIRNLEKGIETDSKKVYRKIFGTECTGNGCYISKRFS